MKRVYLGGAGLRMSGAQVDPLGLGPTWLHFLQGASDVVVFGSDLGLALPAYPWQNGTSTRQASIHA
jgi:hypothetical protein